MDMLNPLLRQVYEAHKEPENAPADWALIQASKIAKEKIDALKKDLSIKYHELVLIPQETRQKIGDEIDAMEEEIRLLYQDIKEAKADYVQIEEQWKKGEETFASIELFYKPQITALEAQADYTPLAQRATVTRRRKPKRKPNDSTFDS